MPKAELEAQYTTMAERGYALEKMLIDSADRKAPSSRSTTVHECLTYIGEAFCEFADKHAKELSALQTSHSDHGSNLDSLKALIEQVANRGYRAFVSALLCSLIRAPNVAPTRSL